MRVTTGNVTLVGTAHVSPKSVQEVEETVRALEPEVVCVELDPTRLKALKDPHAWAQMPVLDLIREGKGPQLLAQIVLGSYQRRIGEETGVTPGQELLTAVETAEAVGAEVVLADREVGITLRRAMQAMPLREKGRVAWEMLKATFAVDEEETFDAEMVDELLEEDALTAAMEELAELAPSASHVLIDERDAYMATRILEARDGIDVRRSRPPPPPAPEPEPAVANGDANATDATSPEAPTDQPSDPRDAAPQADALDAELDASNREDETPDPGDDPPPRPDPSAPGYGGVLAVLGAGHLKGVQAHVEADQRADTDQLVSTESTRFPWGKTLAWGLAVAILGLFGYLVYQGISTGNFQTLQTGLLWYFMLSGVFAAAGCLIAGGGILATMTAFLASPLTSLHPAVAAGWFAGAVEAWRREPRVGDIEGLSEIYTFGDMRENNLVRVILVAALVNLGSIVGSWAGFAKLFDVADVVGMLGVG